MDLVFRIARAWTGNAVEAEDLTQAAFFKAWRAYGSFEPGSSFKAWILMILRNTFLDTRRAMGRRPRPVMIEDLDARDEPQAQVPPPRAIDLDSREIFYDVFGDEITKLMKAIPEEYQVAVLLHDVEEMRYHEIAEALGLPIGTVRSRIHRGRALLADSLAGYAGRIGCLRGGKP